MKNNFISLLFLGLSILTGYSNYLYFKSLHEQLPLIIEWNSYQKKLDVNIVKSFNYKYPNTSITSMPLSFLIGRYFLENDEELALKLIKKSDNDNKYLGAQYTELADYFNNKRLKDSLFYYSQKAFFQLPNNIHFNNYVETLKKFGTEKDLDSAFNYVKKKKNEYKWRMYLFNKVNMYMTESNKDSILNLVKEAEVFFSDKKSLDILKNLIQVGGKFEAYSELLLRANQAFDEGKYKEAFDFFLKLNLMDPQEKTHLYNLAICFFKLKDFDQSIIYFERYIEEFGDDNGKAHFYLATSYLENKESTEACDLLQISLQKGFNPSKTLIEAFCK